jgi:hypothetical protein
VLSWGDCPRCGEHKKLTFGEDDEWFCPECRLEKRLGFERRRVDDVPPPLPEVAGRRKATTR